MPHSAPLNVPDNPTKAGALEALAVFRKPYSSFAFAHEQSEPAAIAAALTLLARDSLPTVPIFLFSSQVPGCGRTLIASITALIGGVAPAVMTFPRGEDEVARALADVASRSSKILLFENINVPLQSNALSNFLTSGEVSMRKLGQSLRTTVAVNATIMGTGTTIGVYGALAHQCVVCDLDPMPAPSLHVPTMLAWVEEQRNELAIAGLTILRAWELADKSDLQLAPMPGFDAWSDRVRSALVWLGMPDPVSECFDAD